MSRSDKELVGQIRSKARTWTGVVCGITGVGNYMVVCTFGTIVAVGGGTYKNGESVVVTRFDTGEYSIIGGASSAMESSVSAIPGSGAVLEGPGIDLNGSYVGIGLDSILLQSISYPAREFFTLAQVVAVAVSGDVILLGARTYTANFTLPAGVTMMGQTSESVLTGLVTLGSGSKLKNLKVSRTSASVDALCGVYCSDDAYLENVVIEVANSVGPAYAMYVDGGAIVEALRTDLIAETGTPGYAAYVENGSLYHSYGLALGSTEYEPYYEV